MIYLMIFVFVQLSLKKLYLGNKDRSDFQQPPMWQDEKNQDLEVIFSINI